MALNLLQLKHPQKVKKPLEKIKKPDIQWHELKFVIAPNLNEMFTSRARQESRNFPYQKIKIKNRNSKEKKNFLETLLPTLLPQQRKIW